MDIVKIAGYFSRIAAVGALAACLGFAAPNQLAYAEGGLAVGTQAAEVVACGGGWELEYSVSDDGMSATIERLAKAGTGKLTVPAAIGSAKVTAIAEHAFYDNPLDASDDACKQISEVELPATLESLGRAAFMNSGLSKIAIPESVASISVNCFAACKSLVQVSFAGATIGYVDEGAFSGCESLVRVDLPEITSHPVTSAYGLGRKCFYGCTSLETVVFGGNAKSGSGNFIANSDCFKDCDNLENLVYYRKHSGMLRGTGTYTVPYADSEDHAVNLYHTLWFYEDADDAADSTKAAYAITCKSTVLAQDILKGTASNEDVWAEMGDKSVLSRSDGRVWVLADGDLVSDTDALDNTYFAVPASRYDLSNGWVSSVTIEDFRANGNSSNTMGSGNSYPQYYIDNSGKVPNLNDLRVYAADGTEVDAGLFTWSYELGTVTGSGNSSSTTWSSSDEPSEVGLYRVHAVGKPGTVTAGTRTRPVSFRVSVFEPTVNAYADTVDSERWGRVAQAAATAVKKNARAAVVVPASDWRYQLIGAALAGAADGIVLVDNGRDVSSRQVNAFSESKVSAIEVVGSKSAVPESDAAADEACLLDFLNERGYKYKSRYADDSTVQALAGQAYASVKKLADRDDDEDGYRAYGHWGATAIVASPDKCMNIQSIAQYAYAQKAPVFFVGAGGLLSSADLGYLKAGGFSRVVIAGGQDYVSEACASGIRSACGIAPVRMFATGGDALEAALSSAADLNGAQTVVIASTSNGADLTAGAVLAASRGGVMLPCACTADSKLIQTYLRTRIVAEGQASVGSVYLVGDFSEIDPTIGERIGAMWESPWSVSIAVGDTIERDGLLYSVAAGSKVRLSAVRDASLEQVVIGDVDYGATRYSLDELPAGFLAGLSKLRTLRFASGPSSVPVSALSGHAALTTVDLGSKVETVGASAFKGCPALSSVTGAGVRSIGAEAFSGCGALTTVAFANAASIGVSAFRGCVALSMASFPQVTTVGASSFQGCSKLLTATFPKATSVGASAFQDCAALGKAELPAATSLGASAFSKCSALSAVSAAKAKTIGANAFSGCKALKSFSSTKVATVGNAAFSGCVKLAKVTLSSTALSKIGSKAFYKCKKLKTLKLKTKKLAAKKVGAKAFSGLPAKAKVYVPKAKVKAYKAAFVKKGLSKKATVKAG